MGASLVPVIKEGGGAGTSREDVGLELNTLGGGKAGVTDGGAAMYFAAAVAAAASSDSRCGVIRMKELNQSWVSSCPIFSSSPGSFSMLVMAWASFCAVPAASGVPPSSWAHISVMLSATSSAVFLSAVVITATSWLYGFFEPPRDLMVIWLAASPKLAYRSQCVSPPIQRAKR